tara:strand:+ start:1038 stop:1649 length:612 start_codon:yes stop_codon:yes gene_type:complete
MIRRGDIIMGKYKSTKTGKVKPKVSLVLDWVPFRGAIQERKLYVFDLDKLYPQVLKKLIKKVGGLEFTNTGEFTYMRVKMGESPRDGSVTFNKYIRDFLQEVDGVWKTYTLKNYKEINLVDFDYSTMFNPNELPSRVSLMETLLKVEEELQELAPQIEFFEGMGQEGMIREDKEDLKKLYSERTNLEKQRDKLLTRKAQGKLT